MLRALLRKSILLPATKRGIFRQFSAASSTAAANGENSRVEAMAHNAENASVGSEDKKLLEVQDLYLRSLADMENLRNRTKREIEAAHQFAIQKFVKDLVPVADVLETAIAHTNSNAKTEQDNSNAAKIEQEQAASIIKAVVTGMEMTLEEFKKVMARHGVTVVDPMHQKFDPNVHMALAEVDRADLEPGTVVHVEKKGYLLNGRVIRAATVAISKK